MQGIQFTYTQTFNRRHRTVGHLFQGRYKAILCDRNEYLLELAGIKRQNLSYEINFFIPFLFNSPGQ